jgi:hypothetical protein
MCGMQDCHQFSPVLLLAEMLMENASDYESIKGLGHEIDSTLVTCCIDLDLNKGPGRFLNFPGAFC